MELKYTHIYWDLFEVGGELEYRPYVRLCPNFMDTEAAGYSHGLSIGNISFETKEEAESFAKNVDSFIYAMIKDYLDTD